ncbi:MAG: FMN-binding protein, partial [Clostridiales bacterium]|nr:FMN-binding protein [Clostridiales bacterium]
MKFKRFFSAALSAVMAVSATNINFASETDNLTEYFFSEETASGGAVSLASEAEEETETEYSFGSGGVTFAPGTYDIGVSLKNASNIENDSMAASCIVSGEMTVAEDGTAKIKVELTSVSMGSITGWASDWLIYQGTVASGDTVAAEETTDSEGNVTAIEFDLPDRSFDGVYVSLYVGVVSMTTNAYLAFDYGSTENSGSGETSAITYTGTATVANFGYEITVYVTVEDGIITALTIDGDGGNETSQAKLEAAAESLSEKLIGLSASDAYAIYSVDGVTSATYSSDAIIEAVMSALSLAIPDDDEEEEGGGSEAVTVSDGSYTADISILKSDSDETS